jgi:hypothetical protein
MGSVLVTFRDQFLVAFDKAREPQLQYVRHGYAGLSFARLANCMRPDMRFDNLLSDQQEASLIDNKCAVH